MMDFLKSRLAAIIYEILFAIWGMTIMSLYFYYYPSYGRSFIIGIELLMLLIGLGLFLLAVIVTARPITALAGWDLSTRQYAQRIKKYLRITSISVPLLVFPAYLYVTSAGWIAYIYYRSGDWQIVQSDILTVVFISLLVVIAFSLGYKLLKLFRYQFDSWLERFLLAEAIGFGVLMLVMYLLGMAGLYYQSIAFIVLASVSVLTYPEIVHLFSHAMKSTIILRIKPFILLNSISILGIALLVSIYMAGAFQQYPTGFDGQHTYAAFPRAYAEKHGIVNFPYWIGSGFPQYGEMLFTLGYLLNGFPLISGIIFIFLVMTGLSVMLLSRALWQNNITAFPILLFLLLPITSHFNIFDNKIDLILSFYVILAFHLVLAYLREGNRSSLVLAGLAGGFAAGVKYNFFSIFYPALIFLIVISKRIKIQEKVRVVSIFSILIFILFSPWAIKNYYYSGNPVEPIAGDYLSRDDVFIKKLSESYKDNIDAIFADGYLWFEDQEKKDFLFYLFLPFRLTYNIKSASQWDAVNISPIYLLSAPLMVFLFLSARRNDEYYGITMFLVAGFMLWSYFTHYLSWYAYPLFIVMGVLLPCAIAHVRRRYIYISFSLFIAVYLISFSTQQFWNRLNYYPLYSSEKDSEYSTLLAGSVIKEIADDGVIWNLLFPVHYYVDNPNSTIIYDQSLMIFDTLSKNKSDEQIIAELRQLGVKYFLLKSNGSEYATFNLDNSYRFRDTSPVTAQRYIDANINFFKFRNKNLDLLWDNNDFYLYILK